MSHTENTIALDANWDISFDSNGDLRRLTGLEAILQNVCNETRLWYRDAYFRYDEGIDWFTDQLGQPLQESVVTERLRNAALSVPGVISIVNIELTEIDQETRTLHGKIEIETQYGYGTSYL